MKIFTLVRFFCRSVIASSIYAGFSTAVAAAPRTHCKAEEKMIFNCSFENKKTISICASHDLTSTSGSLQYRYGVVRKRIELQYPTLTNRSSEKFSLHDSTSARWHDRTVSFIVNDYSYSILSYENINIPENEFSVSIFKNKKRITYLNCLSNSVYDETWTLKEILK